MKSISTFFGTLKRVCMYMNSFRSPFLFMMRVVIGLYLGAGSITT